MVWLVTVRIMNFPRFLDCQVSQKQENTHRKRCVVWWLPPLCRCPVSSCRPAFGAAPHRNRNIESLCLSHTPVD